MNETTTQKLPKEFYWLAAARLSSTFGMYLNMLVVNIFVLELTGSALWVGWLMAVRVISGMLFSPYIGALADKTSRKTIMVASDFILAFFIFATVFVPIYAVKYYFIWAMLVIGVFSSALDIALSAAVPSILHSGNTIKANAVLMGGRNIVIAIAGLCSVFIKELFADYNAVFAVNALAYLVCGLIVFSLKIKMNEARPQRPAGLKQPENNFLKTLKEDYKDVFALPNFKVIAVMIFILTLDGLASGSHNVGWPLFSKSLGGENPFFIYGFLMAFWGFGNIIGIFWLAKSSLAKKLRAENLYLICTAIMSLGMIMTVQSSLPALIFAASCFAGFGDGAYQTFFNAYLQSSPDGVRGKLFGLSSTCLRTGFGAGFIIIPFLFNAFAVSKVLLYAHGPLVLISILFILLLNRPAKKPACD